MLMTLLFWALSPMGRWTGDSWTCTGHPSWGLAGGSLLALLVLSHPWGSPNLGFRRLGTELALEKGVLGETWVLCFQREMASTDWCSRIGRA
jgi:hypothetical protein